MPPQTGFGGQMIGQDFSALNQALARIANQNDPVRTSQINTADGPLGPLADSSVMRLLPVLDAFRQRRIDRNPAAEQARQGAEVQRFQSRRDVVPQRVPQVRPDGTGSDMINTGGFELGGQTDLRRQAETFRDPNFPQVVQGQQQQSLIGAINEAPGSALSGIFGLQRQGMADQARRELAILNQAAATGRTALSQEQQNRRAQLTALLGAGRLQSDIEQNLPTQFGFGGPSDELQQILQMLQGQINTDPNAINQDFGQGAIDQTNIQVGQTIMGDDGIQYQVTGFDQQGQPLGHPVQ
jgi:hypothetical protein